MSGGDPGGAAAEALRLLAGLQDWARHDLGEHIATGAAECQYCPLCAAIAVLRGDRPDVTAKLAEAGIGLLTAIRAAFEPAPAWPGAGPGGEPGPGAGRRAEHHRRHRERPPAGSRVERIDLD